MPATTPIRVNSVPWWLWLAPIVLFLVATERMAYGYYTFTRVAICGFAFFVAFIGWGDRVASHIWSVILGAIAVLFNPIVPIYLSQRTWHRVDFCVAILLVVHLVFVRLGWLQTKGS